MGSEWLDALGIESSVPWYFEMTLATRRESCRLDLNIYPEEWGFVFRDNNRVSAIRITDEPFVVSGSDDLMLLKEISQLARIDDFVGLLERRPDVLFERKTAQVRSNLRRATPIVRAWLNTL